MSEGVELEMRQDLVNSVATEMMMLGWSINLPSLPSVVMSEIYSS